MSDDSAAELPSEFVEIDGAPVEVTYPDRPTKVVEFITGLFGKTYAVFVIDGDTRSNVSEAWRYGTLGAQWIHNFYRAAPHPT